MLTDVNEWEKSAFFRWKTAYLYDKQVKLELEHLMQTMATATDFREQKIKTQALL
jgi:hypothetical protein